MPAAQEGVVTMQSGPPVPGASLSGNLAVLSDILLRYGLGTVLALFLVWNMVNQQQDYQQAAAQRGQQIIQMLTEQQRTQLEITRALDRISNRLDNPLPK